MQTIPNELLRVGRVWVRTTVPTVTDDADAGYVVGDTWYRVFGAITREYRLADATAGAAQWKVVGLPVASDLYDVILNLQALWWDAGDFEWKLFKPMRAPSMGATVGNIPAFASTNGQFMDDSGVGKADLLSGWFKATGTWTYTSADAPTFIASVPDADAALFGVGWKIKLTQTSVKYFIVVAKGTPSGGFTPVTLYGGTDYTLVSAAITSPCYSPAKTPLDFPPSPAKWSVSLVDSGTNRSQLTSGTTVYNLGSLSLSCPIGLWRPKLGFLAQISGAAQPSKFANFSLSTANNTINAAMSFSLAAGASNVTTVRNWLYAEFPLLDRATKQTYYITGVDANAGGNTIWLLNATNDLSLIFECAYL